MRGSLPPARRGRGTSLAGLLALWTACAAPRPPAPASVPLAAPPSGLVPSAPPAREYVSPGPRRPPGRPDPLWSALVEAATSAAGKVGAPVPRHDARLDGAATDVARSLRLFPTPSFEVISFLLGHHGIVEPEPNLIILRSTNGGPEGDQVLVDHIGPQLPEVLRPGIWRRIGVGVDRQGGEVIAILALQEQNFELDALPRRLRAGGSAVISGRLQGAFSRPELLVTVPAGRVRPIPVQVDGARFRAMLACNAGDGPYQVELLAVDSRGPSVLANFPVFCGVEPPGRTPPIAPEGVGPNLDVAKVAEEVFALVNRDRQAAGLPSLVWDRRLAEVARGHSREMADTGVVAHLSPRTGSPMDRVRAAGMQPLPSLVTENVGRAYSALQVHRGLMASPGHRQNVVDSRVTHIGIGVVAGRPEPGATPLFLTQVFAAWPKRSSAVDKRGRDDHHRTALGAHHAHRP